MKYTKAQIKEALRTSRAKWVVPKKGEKVLRSDEKCGFCEMVGNNFDITGGKCDIKCIKCRNIFWDGEICVDSLEGVVDASEMDSGNPEWPEACRIMQSEFDRIEEEFCGNKVYEVECEWKHDNYRTYPNKESGGVFMWRDFIGKRTKLTIEVLD